MEKNKKSIFTIEVYDLDKNKFNQVTNTFNSALNALENIVCNLQSQSKFVYHSAFITECKFDKNGLLVPKVIKNHFGLNLFTEFWLTDDIHQFHNIAMDLIEKKNEIEKLNS